MDATYAPVPATGFTAKLKSSQRRKLLDAFKEFIQAKADGTILNVRAAPASLSSRSDTPDALDPLDESLATDGGARITAWDMPHDKTQRPERLQLPFADGAFDWVYCDELIERSGNFERQYALLKELTRVARRGVFVTTSNRKHPIEFNTSLPLLHWLPDAWWRRVLKIIGKGAWASESVLNLLDSAALYKLASLLPGKPANDVGHKRVFGIKAYFFLMIRKNAVAEKAGAKPSSAPVA